MLKRLRVDNFKSLINVVFEPSSVNILTGRNNTGKTTLCQAINFLRNTVYQPVAEAASFATGDIWNLTNAYLNKDSLTFGCECDLEVDERTYGFLYNLVVRAQTRPATGTFERECAVLEERLTVSGEQFGSGTTLLENLASPDRPSANDVKLLHEGKHERHEDDLYVETTAPTNVTMLNRLYDLQFNRYANVFKKYMASWLYYDLDPAKLRGVEAKQSGLVLNTDGSNLSHVLFQLKNFDERRYRKFVDIVKEVEPRLEALNFVPPTQESVFMSLTDSRDNRFQVWSISNGTLRFMAITYVIMMTTAMAEARGALPPLVLIEEPENGIHVGHLKRLVELVAPEGERDPQFIFSTHSPYFIDFFDKFTDGVFVMRSDDTHAEIVKPDPRKLEEVLKHFDLGEAHFRELLG